MPSLSLPPWIPSPSEALDGGDASKLRWVHALTPALFALSWGVVFVACNADRSCYGGIVFPLAALVVAISVVPIARCARRVVTAASTQAAYLSLASLSPWLAFGWVGAAMSDFDGGAGGALGASALTVSSLVLLGVLPLTLRASMRAPVLPGRRWIVHASACCITGLALSSGVFSACHPTADALVNYRAYPATFERDVRTGRYEVYAREGLRLRQQRAGNRCVTQPVYRDESVSSVHDALVHDCASPVVLYGYPWGTSLRRGLFERPVYRELVFASVEGQVICNKTAARYLLFTAPLWEWIVSAIAGVLLGLWTLSVTRRTIATWRALSVRRANANGGLARCEDGTTVAFAGVLYGPVVVPGDPEPGAPFRDASLRATYVFAGSVEEWERALTACESVATSFALAVVWLPASPLLAAPFLGMLTPL